MKEIPENPRPSSPAGAGGTLADVVEAIPSAVLLVDGQGLIRMANRACRTILGYEPEELIGQSVETLLPAAARDRHREQRAQYAERPSVRPVGARSDLVAQRKDGRLIPVDISLGPVETAEGPMSVALVNDISERKASEQLRHKHERQLEQSNEELEQFAYVVSHDLRSPLQGVNSLAGFIEEDVGESLPDESREHFRLLRKRVQRMEMLLNDLLNYSRVGRVEAAPRTVNTGKLVREIAELLAPPAGFTIAAADDLPAVFTPEPALQLVLRNLISNAIKHHDRETGQITVAGEPTDDGHHFVVRDDGPGIEPRFHDKVFKMFQTLKPRDQMETSGLGLAIVSKTVKQHGGRVWIESDGDRGCAFHFTWLDSEPETPTVTPTDS